MALHLILGFSFSPQGLQFSSPTDAVSLPWKTVEQMRADCKKMEHDDRVIAGVMYHLQSEHVSIPPLEFPQPGASVQSDASGQAAGQHQADMNSTSSTASKKEQKAKRKAEKDAKEKALEDFWEAMKLEVQ